MSTPCYHTIVKPATKLCSRCGQVVAGAARVAARLRGQHAEKAAGGAPTTATVANHGVTRLTVVRGDAVGEVAVLVRERRDGDVAATDLVGEVVEGCDAVGIVQGTVLPVRARPGRLVVDDTQDTPHVPRGAQ